MTKESEIDLDPIVITGMGVVSPIGNSVPEFSKSLREGRCGWGPIRSFPCDQFPVKHAYEVDPSVLVTRYALMDPFIQYALKATEQALEDARLDPAKEDRQRIAISVSSSKGGMITFERAHRELREKKASWSALRAARAYANLAPNMAAQWIARTYRIEGPAVCPVAACATGTHAVIAGFHLLQDGRADMCIAGATDACITPLMLAGYHRMGVCSPEVMRPYDQKRKGFVVGDGAGVVILERLSSARKRGVAALAQIRSVVWGNDAFDPLHFHPKQNTLAWILQSVCQKGGVPPQELDYVNTHGTGTVEGDAYELAQLERVFGRFPRNVSFSSTKSMTGHMLGAAGAVEFMACCIAMREGFVPPTIHIQKLDKRCTVDVTPNRSQPKTIRRSLSFSMGFGGHVSAILMEKVEG